MKKGEARAMQGVLIVIWEPARYAHLRTLVSKKYIRKFTIREIFLRDFLHFGRYLTDICHNSLVL